MKLPNGLTVTESTTTPSRAGKQPRPVWVVSGLTAGFEQSLIDLGGRKWKGAYSFFSDPTDELSKLSADDRLTFAERLERDKERAAERAERFEGYSDNAEARSNAAYARVRAIGDMIPLGQPVLLGHHSEKGHRADIKRMDNGMRKTVEESRKSDYWKERAEAANRKAKGEHSAAFCDRRIKECESKLRDFQRKIDKIPEQKVVNPDHDAAYDEYSERLGLLVEEEEGKLAYWKSELEARGGIRFSRENIKVGDLVRYWGKWAEVVRVNATTVSLKTPYTWTDKVKYSDIYEHEPKGAAE